MFRRFMIVCWVLFSVCALPATVSGVMLLSDKNKMLSLRSDEMTAAGITSAHRIREALKEEKMSYWVAIELKQKGIDIENWSDDQKSVAEKLLYRAYERYMKSAQGLDELDETELNKRLDDSKQRLATANAIHDREEALTVVSGLGGIAAGVLLLWNILWHTGHWIWMGRESG